MNEEKKHVLNKVGACITCGESSHDLKAEEPKRGFFLFGRKRDKNGRFTK